MSSSIACRQLRVTFHNCRCKRLLFIDELTYAACSRVRYRIDDDEILMDASQKQPMAEGKARSI